MIYSITTKYAKEALGCSMDNMVVKEGKNSIPVFKETLWEWRSFGTISPNIYNKISYLPIKVEKPIKMVDRYLCKVGCEVNIKLRDKDLRIKSFHCKTDMGIEHWTTEVYKFPISPIVFKNITRALKLEITGREVEVENDKQLLSILSDATQSIIVISVWKQRELHIWPPNSRDPVTIELAEISKPERITTISVEHQNLEKVSKALELLQLASASMKVLNYVDCLKVWIEQGKVFE